MISRVFFNSDTYYLHYYTYVYLGRGDTTTGEDGTMGADLGNGLLEWRIFPTSVLKVAEESQRSSKMTSKIATKVTSKLTKVLHRQAREPQGGPVSRDELFHRLLKDQRNEIHVEDFLWTGSGKDFIIKIITSLMILKQFTTFIFFKVYILCKLVYVLM